MRGARIIFFLLPLIACTAGEDYRPPSVVVPERWIGADLTSPPSLKASADTPAPEIGIRVAAPPEAGGAGWWKALDDPTLNGLIAIAIENNNDIKAAESRVQAARAEYLVARASFKPEIGAAAHAKRGNEGLISQNKAIDLYDAGFDASWELDLFGGKERKAERALALAGAEEAARAGTVLSLSAELARNYIEARGLQHRLATLELHIGAEAEQRMLLQSQYNAGLINASDVIAAEAEYETLKGRAPMLRAAYDAALGRINTLMGVAPGTVDSLLAEPRPVPAADPAATLATPAEVIRKRPDVLQAERALAAASANKAVSEAALFPKLTLSGLLGWQNTSSFPSATLWSAASQLAAPVASFGRLEAAIDAADARQAEALAAYKQSVLKALEEVEAALSAYVNENTRQASLKAAVISKDQALDLAYERYGSGLSPFTEVLAAEKELYAAEEARIESQIMLTQNAVALYKALGGGAAPPEPQGAPATPPAPEGAEAPLSPEAPRAPGGTVPDAPDPEPLTDPGNAVL